MRYLLIQAFPFFQRISSSGETGRVYSWICIRLGFRTWLDFILRWFQHNQILAFLANIKNIQYFYRLLVVPIMFSRLLYLLSATVELRVKNKAIFHSGDAQKNENFRSLIQLSSRLYRLCITREPQESTKCSTTLFRELIYIFVRKQQVLNRYSVRCCWFAIGRIKKQYG